MMTSNFARCGSNPKAVSISIGVPPWYPGKRFLDVAPRRDMLKLPKDDYDREYQKILDSLDPVQVYKKICDMYGEDSILLCWESPNVRCHRRWVAEWLEAANGIIVPEYGFKREDILPYKEMPMKGEAVKKPVRIA
jgi:hypothetical protein